MNRAIEMRIKVSARDRSFNRVGSGKTCRLVLLLGVIFLFGQVITVSHAYLHAPAQQDVACVVCVQGAHGGAQPDIGTVHANPKVTASRVQHRELPLPKPADRRVGGARSPPAALIKS